MIKKYLPGFSFKNPSTKEVINLRIGSVNVSVRERRIRATWTPELAQDVSAFHNIDAEAELTALLENEINNQVVREHLETWTQIVNGHRAPADLNQIEDNQWPNLLPLTMRVSARTLGTDLVAVQPLTTPLGILNYISGFDPYIVENNPNYTILPNNNGWYMDGTFESVLIKMNMKKFYFVNKRRTRRRPGDLLDRI